MKKLIYIMNPMCGWCFGNSKSFEKLNKNFQNEFDIEVCLGEMWFKNDAPYGSNALKHFVVSDAVRLKEITKQSPSQKFFDLAGDSSYRLDSYFPTSAMMAIKKIDHAKFVTFIQRVQKRLFIDGFKLDAIEAYEDILKELSIDVNEFKKLWLSDENLHALQEDFSKAKLLTSSYPTLLLQDDEDTQVLARGYFKYEDMEKILSTKMTA